MAASLVSAESTAAAAREAQLRPLDPVSTQPSALPVSAAAPVPTPQISEETAPAPAASMTSRPTASAVAPSGGGAVVRQTGARVAHTLVGLTSPSQRGKIGLDAAAAPSKFPAPRIGSAIGQVAADEIASPTPMEISVSTPTEMDGFE